MGKSIRSKVKKRLRTAKRQRIDAMLVRPREEEHFSQLTKQMNGQGITLSTPKNAFKYPKAKDAIFPQKEIVKPIDFRSENLPMAGYTYRGNRRKYDAAEQQYMDNLARNSHPEMETLAGGGAVLATGEKVTKLEAEMIATSVQKPEAFARVNTAASAASAVQAAVAADSAMDESTPVREVVPDGPVPENKADTSRRPIVTNVSRNKRIEQNQTQLTKKSSRKSKPNPAANPEGNDLVKKKALKAKSPKKGDGGDMAVDA